jgi:hypothetical protein
MVNYVCIHKQSSWNLNSNTQEPRWAWHDNRAAYVIAQQYSSSTSILCRFYLSKEKFMVCFKNDIILFIFTSLEMCKSETAYVGECLLNFF